jgi:hypothetical protein
LTWRTPKYDVYLIVRAKRSEAANIACSDFGSIRANGKSIWEVLREKLNIDRVYIDTGDDIESDPMESEA